jgi:hypothetical protein
MTTDDGIYGTKLKLCQYYQDLILLLNKLSKLKSDLGQI